MELYPNRENNLNLMVNGQQESRSQNNSGESWNGLGWNNQPAPSPATGRDSSPAAVSAEGLCGKQDISPWIGWGSEASELQRRSKMDLRPDLI